MSFYTIWCYELLYDRLLMIRLKLARYLIRLEHMVSSVTRARQVGPWGAGGSGAASGERCHDEGRGAPGSLGVGGAAVVSVGAVPEGGGRGVGA